MDARGHSIPYHYGDLQAALPQRLQTAQTPARREKTTGMIFVPVCVVLFAAPIVAFLGYFTVVCLIEGVPLGALYCAVYSVPLVAYVVLPIVSIRNYLRRRRDDGLHAAAMHANRTCITAAQGQVVPNPCNSPAPAPALTLPILPLQAGKEKTTGMVALPALVTLLLLPFFVVCTFATGLCLWEGAFVFALASGVYTVILGWMTALPILNIRNFIKRQRAMCR
jgi:hypothetical protein